MFLWRGKTSRSQEIDDKRLQKELGSSDRTGKPVELSEDIRVMHDHDGTGEPVKSSASTHTVEEFVLVEHRDTASSNANIDFNIPGVPNSMVKTIIWRQCSQLDSENREPPSATSISK